MAKGNRLLRQQSGSRLSPYLQEKLVYIGQLDSYERGSEIAFVLMNVQTNDTAIYRLTDEVGAQCEELEKEESLLGSSPCMELDSSDYLYVQSDGSMLLTREAGWKEVKLGRVFKSSAVYSETKDRHWIRQSQYRAHLGGHAVFENLMSALIDEPYRHYSQRVVFLSDGAKWQWKWAEAEYPKALQILDFYHVMEHIGHWLGHCFKSTKQVDKRLKTIGHILKHKGVNSMENYLANIPRKTPKQQQTYEQLKTYIANNRTRMNYPQYLAKGLLIGSGAIESAHRTVLQRRMKLAGQRWSKKGLSHMIKLRTLKMSGGWDKVVQLIRA